MAPLAPAGTEVLAGLEMGGIPVVTMLSHVTGLPAAFVRKEAKDYGTCRYAEGASLQGKRLVLVEDVVSSGSAILAALDKLKADDLVPIAALWVIDRQPAARRRWSRWDCRSVRSLRWPRSSRRDNPGFGLGQRHATMIYREANGDGFAAAQSPY